jgi:uracil DNA glycosylase
VNWATHGVLLLNTCLTVEEAQPASHAGKGWEVLTDAVIRHVAASARPVVFMLWGSHAQSKRALIDVGRHKVLMSNHPSPLSACYISRFAGEVAEWLMAADCKSALLRVRWFESSPLHQR